jgi:hypothetical protein
MTRSKTVLLTTAFAALLVSCFELSEFHTETNSFYAQNMVTKAYYTVSAEILAEGDTCVVWAEKGSGVTASQAREVATEYDTIVRPRVVGAFSKKNFTGSYNGKEYEFADMLHYANRITGRDNGKLTILLLDIKDNSNNDSYVAGYFFPGNFYKKGSFLSGNTTHYSNGVDMIYIDTRPGLERYRKQTYATLAHELQHLINFITTLQTGRSYMDAWIDEGLSAYAEYLYFEENPTDRCEWFSDDPSGTIAKGNNFFVWDNYPEEPLAILDDYATVYLFFRWLYLQAGNESILYEIENSGYSDYRAVTSVAAQIIDPSYNNWETLLGNWFAANYSPTNPEYGYKNDSYLQETIKIKPIAESTISLYPGEGVYSIINDPFTAVSGTNIRYAGLDGNTPIVSSPYSGNVLLTFNANSNKAANRETGRLTGEPVPLAQQLAKDRSIRQFTGPYVMDARDVLGRDREKSLPGILGSPRNEP